MLIQNTLLDALHSVMITVVGKFATRSITTTVAKHTTGTHTSGVGSVLMDIGVAGLITMASIQAIMNSIIMDIIMAGDIITVAMVDIMATEDIDD